MLFLRMFLFYDRLMHSHSKKNHALMKDYARVYYQDIVKLLHKMPSDMLLVMKTNDCLRHIDHLLKAPINSVSGKLIYVIL